MGSWINSMWNHRYAFDKKPVACDDFVPASEMGGAHSLIEPSYYHTCYNCGHSAAEHDESPMAEDRPALGIPSRGFQTIDEEARIRPDINDLHKVVRRGPSAQEDYVLAPGKDCLLYTSPSPRD